MAMPDGALVWLVLVLLAFFGLWGFIGRFTGVDLGAWFRGQWFSWQAHRWEKLSSPPLVVKRTYWTPAEFTRDQVRLAGIGYRIVDQSSPQRASQEYLLGPRSSRYRRRLPAFCVTYQRTVAA